MLPNLSTLSLKRRSVQGDRPDEPTSFLDLPGVVDPVFEQLLLINRNECAVDLPTEASTKAEALKVQIMGFCKSVPTFKRLCREQLPLYLQTEVLRIENEVLPRLWNEAKDELDRRKDWKIDNLTAPFTEDESYILSTDPDAKLDRPKISKTMRNLTKWNVWDVASRRNGMHEIKHLRLINPVRSDVNGAYYELPDGERIDLSEGMVCKMLVHVWGIEKWASRHMIIYQPVGMFRTHEEFVPDRGDYCHVSIDEKNHGPYEALDMSAVTSFDIYSLDTDFNLPIGAWNVSKVYSMDSLFHDTHAFNQPIGAWDMSNVKSTMSMFMDAISFNQPIGDWDVSKVDDFSQMFYDAINFNQPIGKWKVSNPRDMSNMFNGASSFNQSLREWSLNGNIEDMFKGTFDMVPDNYPAVPRPYLWKVWNVNYNSNGMR